MVDVEIEFSATIGTVQEAGKHILFHRLGRSAFRAFPDTLYHFPCLTVNNRLMDALENHMVFLRVFIPPLVFERFGIGLEVYHIPHVLAGIEDFIDCGLAPIIGAVFISSAGLYSYPVSYAANGIYVVNRFRAVSKSLPYPANVTTNRVNRYLN